MFRMAKVSNKEALPAEFPSFVSYHFLNAKGQLMAMEENGSSTTKMLKEGNHIDGSSITGMSCVEKSDLKLVPEPDSFRIIKLGEGLEHPRFLAHIVDGNGKPHPRDPRGILKRLVDKAHDMGFEPYMFSEIEFFIVDKDGNPADNAGYCSLPPLDKSVSFRKDLAYYAKENGVAVKRLHHENGPGQNEMELNLTPSLKNADDTVLCMWIMDLLAASRDQKIIFSPKPFKDEAGNGLHHHIMLRDLATGENVFMNPELKDAADNPAENSRRLSTICKHAIAGLLKYADDITAVFAESNETFERLKPGFEAPICKAWDFSNRTALVRVPQSSNEMTRFEYRGGDLSGSVHLFGSVLLAAILKGIEDELECPSNSNFNVELLSDEERARLGISPVPLSLEKCIDVLKNSKLLKEALGQEMVQFLIERDEAALANA